MKKKYPASLFISGFIMNLTIKFWYMFVSAVVLEIIGIRVSPCLYIGLGVFMADVIAAFIYQLYLRNATLKSDNDNFSEFQDAMLSHEWKNNIGELIEKKISED